MSNSVKRNVTKRKSKRGGAGAEAKAKPHNPFSVPGDAQLLAYWHYKNRRNERDKADGAEPPLQVFRKAAAASNAFSMSDYVRDIRLLSKWKLVAGLKRDCVIQIDQKLNIERQRFLRIKRKYLECVESLEQFVAKDHDESMRALGQADNELARTLELSEKRDELSREYGAMRLEVYRWEEAFRTVRACHRFLHQLAENRLDDDDDDDDDDVANDLNDLLDDAKATKDSQLNISDIGSLESLISEPHDLLRRFSEMEIQNVSALVNLESLGGPMVELKDQLDRTERSLRDELNEIAEDIEATRRKIRLEERRAERFEAKAARLKEDKMVELVASARALHTRSLIEQAYKSCCLQADGDALATARKLEWQKKEEEQREAQQVPLKPILMVKALEDAYEKMCCQLDALPRYVVAVCEKEGFRAEMKKMREAEEAAKKRALARYLANALKRIMEPTPPRTRPLMKRSRPRLRTKRLSTLQAEAANQAEARARELREMVLQRDLFGRNSDDDDDDEPSQADRLDDNWSDFYDQGDSDGSENEEDASPRSRDRIDWND
ncbi:uncharacterized protein LOC106648168 [Trichogramma pretiosum]|uniref:uncharacterized protein LOC106648168 n=1 Tax=Trichogramma pretiosum TaxID=7493 RepID=UPI000C71B2EE|nr:uncharacterized protein LOC106648168 [Trichogramma pretiosum]